MKTKKVKNNKCPGKRKTPRGQEAHRHSSCLHSLFMKNQKTKLLYICVCVCVCARMWLHDREI